MQKSKIVVFCQVQVIEVVFTIVFGVTCIVQVERRIIKQVQVRICIVHYVVIVFIINIIVKWPEDSIVNVGHFEKLLRFCVEWMSHGFQKSVACHEVPLVRSQGG